jgi:hypothetical protein
MTIDFATKNANRKNRPFGAVAKKKSNQINDLGGPKTNEWEYGETR